MPRKPSLPPSILRVESLSDGRAIRPLFVENDLKSGELIPVKQDDSPPRVMKSGNELLAELAQVEAKASAANHKLALDTLFPDRVQSKPSRSIVPAIPGMRPTTKLGDKLMIYTEANPIRRGY